MPKGDAEQLKADVDDGFARVSRLLLEAMCTMPFTGTEQAVFWFVVRRTYGWANPGDRQSGKLDLMTADDIALGTCRSRRTVETAIGSLVKANVLIRELVTDPNRYAYGINSDVSQWGLPTVEWREAKVGLREARERDAYTRKHVDMYAKTRTRIRENAYISTRNHVDSPPTNPRAPGVSCPLTERRLDRENVNDVECVLGLEEEPPRNGPHSTAEELSDDPFAEADVTPETDEPQAKKAPPPPSDAGALLLNNGDITDLAKCALPEWTQAQVKALVLEIAVAIRDPVSSGLLNREAWRDLLSSTPPDLSYRSRPGWWVERCLRDAGKQRDTARPSTASRPIPASDAQFAYLLEKKRREEAIASAH